MTANRSTVGRLNRELRRLETALGFNIGELQVKWEPKDCSPQDAEVKDLTVHIYNRDPEAARASLKHELIELAISRAIEAPYKRLVIQLFKTLDEELYRRREELVERLAKVL